MSSQWTVRADAARALGIFIVLTALVGVSTGGAYLVGAAARKAVAQAKIQRLADAAAKGFSERALEASTGEPGALAIARRHDRSAALDEDQAGRVGRLAEFGDRLQARGGADDDPVLRRLVVANFDVSGDYASRPSRVQGFLEESRELGCLTQAVYYEARGEETAGQAAVAQVVLNRVRHPAFPKSVCAVVFQGANSDACQFSFACDGSVHRRVERAAWRRAERVAARALDGFVMAQVGSATHFHVADIAPEWGPKLLRVTQVGQHVFYRFTRRPPPEVLPPVEPAEPAAEPAAVQPVLASLSLAPLANSVAASVANSVAAGAGLVMAAASPRPPAAVRPEAPVQAAKTPAAEEAAPKDSAVPG